MRLSFTATFLPAAFAGLTLACSFACAQAPVAELGPFSAAHRDADMVSPKSVLFHPSGNKFYVNALEAGKTLVYDARTLAKLAVIPHTFTSHDSLTPAGPNSRTFFGKPVEGWFTHDGRYLWVTYYRWSDDGAAMRASGFAVIDTTTDQVLRAYATGNIPKFVTANADSTELAVTLWGENRVELFDIRDPLHAVRTADIQVGPKVVAAAGSDRDATCGMCLRGTAYIPGTSWLAVARMSAGGGLSIVDTASRKVVADWPRMPATPRHLQVYGDWLYMSANQSGTVARIALADIKRSVAERHTPAVQARKVGAGARTLKVVDGQVYVALNESRKVGILPLDLSSVRYLDAPAYPVGLDVKAGRLAVTSQGHHGQGGHRVWVYDVASPAGH
jgi:DNA-binding beta-propeller fold protein YncE